MLLSEKRKVGGKSAVTRPRSLDIITTVGASFDHFFPPCSLGWMHALLETSFPCQHPTWYRHYVSWQVSSRGGARSRFLFFVLFPCHLMEFALRGTAFHGVHNVAGKEVRCGDQTRTGVVESQPSE